MIEVVALAGAINSISGAITSSIQAGRSLHQLPPNSLPVNTSSKIFW
tara:strand:+ start:642 stop:782 length:141 start_codon:yes stop_codon:yes gene_type:complete